MHYPYHFVALNDDQTARRRHLLDGYAQFAQLSILLVPLIFYLSRGIQLLLSKLSRQHGLQGAKEHGSPVVAKFNRPAASSSRNVLARLRWALEDEVVEGWGTRQEWLVAGMWAMWLLLLAVKDTGDGMYAICIDVTLVPIDLYEEMFYLRAFTVVFLLNDLPIMES